MEGQRVREKERESGKADTANSQLNGGSLHFCSEFIISPACPYSAYFLLHLPATHIIPYAHTHTLRERAKREIAVDTDTAIAFAMLAKAQFILFDLQAARFGRFGD